MLVDLLVAPTRPTFLPARLSARRSLLVIPLPCLLLDGIALAVLPCADCRPARDALVNAFRAKVGDSIWPDAPETGDKAGETDPERLPLGERLGFLGWGDRLPRSLTLPRGVKLPWSLDSRGLRRPGGVPGGVRAGELPLGLDGELDG